MRTLIISDLHLTRNDNTIKRFLPLRYYLLYKNIKDILKSNIDIVVINGDIIDNQNSIDLITENFIFELLTKIFKNQLVIVNEGNHDIIGNIGLDTQENELNEMYRYISFVNLLTKLNSIQQCSTLKRFRFDNFIFHIIPYSQKENEILDFILDKQFNYSYFYHFFFFHNDMNIVEDKMGYKSGKSIDMNKITNQIKQRTSKYQIFEGHYHYHEEYDDYKMHVISSIPRTWSEKIYTIDQLDNYFGYYIIDQKNSEDVKVTFNPWKYQIGFVEYNSYDKMMNDIMNHSDDFDRFFIHIKQKNLKHKEYEKINSLRLNDHILSIQTEFELENTVLNEGIDSNIEVTDINEFVIEFLKELELEDEKKNSIITQFKELQNNEKK